MKFFTAALVALSAIESVSQKMWRRERAMSNENEWGKGQLDIYSLLAYKMIRWEHFIMCMVSYCSWKQCSMRLYPN